MARLRACLVETGVCPEFTIESTRKEAEQEEQQARRDLEAALIQVRSLNNSLPGAYKEFLKELERVLANGEKIIAQFQTLKDKDAEAHYLAELIGEEINLPPRYQMATEVYRTKAGSKQAGEAGTAPRGTG